MKRHFYVDDHADELMPCAATLEAWAEWLSKDDPSWPHQIPDDGEIFKVSTIDELARLAVTKTDDGWSIHGEVPAGADGFVCTDGAQGWDAETWSETPLGYLEESDGWYPEGATEELVCTRSGPNLICRFEAAGPRLVIVGEVQ